jgi:hypothetical protein
VAAAAASARSIGDIEDMEKLERDPDMVEPFELILVEVVVDSGSDAIATGEGIAVVDDVAALAVAGIVDLADVVADPLLGQECAQ